MTTDELVSVSPEAFEAAVIGFDSQTCGHHAKAIYRTLESRLSLSELELHLLDRLDRALNEDGGAQATIEKLYQVAKHLLPYEEDTKLVKLVFLIMQESIKGRREFLDLFYPDRLQVISHNE